MWPDVVDLRDFYDSRMGQMTRHIVRRTVRQMWPSLENRTVLGLGYATPYLRQYRSEAGQLIAFMPGPQGIVHWPPEGPGVVALIDETDLPLPDYSVDRVLMVHAVENSEFLRALMEEVWRVLTGDGRLLVVAPNRAGIWAHLERTPFGWGHPYSGGQLSRLLRQHMFMPERTAQALFLPPTRSRTLLRLAPGWERVGRRLCPTFAGAVIVEARKQLYAATPKAKPRRARRTSLIHMPAGANVTCISSSAGGSR